MPCGQCVGCRLEYSRQWAIRSVHEASTHDENCFITLTYDDDNLPENGSVDKTHFQKFMKRLRKAYSDTKIRFLACGEYGEKSNRPHYHAILFGKDFLDKTPLKQLGEHTLYESPSLSKLWPYGHCSVGSVTFESAAYVARYVMKKAKGKHIDDIDSVTGLKPYERYDSVSGEIIEVMPEFFLQSRKPGIGNEWYKTFKEDCYPSDFCVINGHRVRVPKYYDNLLTKEDAESLEKYKGKRRAMAKKHESENTVERLRTKEYCQISKLNQMVRTI